MSLPRMRSSELAEVLAMSRDGGGAEEAVAQARAQGMSHVGEAMMNVALALMRETKEGLQQVNAKLDEIAKERREEAREHGGLEVRVATLEGHYKRQQGILYTIIGAVLLSILGFIVRLAISHPDAVPK